MRGTKRGYRKILTRIRWTAREIAQWQDRHANDVDVGLLDEIDKLRLGLDLIMEMVTRALDGRTDGKPACIKCKKADPTIYKRFCAPCWEAVKTEFRETWMASWPEGVPFPEGQAFEELVLAFFGGEPDEKGESDEQ